MLGVVLGLSAALGFGVSAIFARLGLQYMRSTSATLVSLMIGTAITMALAFALRSSEIVDLSLIAFAWFLLLGLITFPLGRLMNYTGVSMAGVSRASPIVGASPLFATTLAVTVGGETLNLALLMGTISITAGLGFILSQR